MEQLLFSLPPNKNRRRVAPGIYIEDLESSRRVIIGAARVMEYDMNDRFSNNMACALLSELGCPQADIARALGIHRHTVARISDNVEKLGLAGLVDCRNGSPGPRKRTPAMEKKILSLYRKGYTALEIYGKLCDKNGQKISLRSIQRTVTEFRKKTKNTSQPEVSNQVEEFPLFPSTEADKTAVDSGEGISEEVVEESMVHSPEEEVVLEDEKPASDKVSLQEALISPTGVGEIADAPGTDSPAVDSYDSSSGQSEDAAFDALDGAAPFLPEPGKGVSYAGAFLAWPFFCMLGIAPLAFHLYGDILKVKGRVYDLVQSFVSFFFLTLLGFETLESFKTVFRDGFRRLIGTMTTPTVKTLRRKLGVIAAAGKGFEFLMGLAKRYCALGMVEEGVLYLDGHFVPYFGKRHMGKGYYTLRRIAHPGRVQHFVNDRNGRPLFFLLQEADHSFTKAIPELIKETHELVGDRQVTFIYDRGGYSAALLKEIAAGGDLFITYKKGKFRSVPGGAFRPCKVVSKRWGKQFKKTYDVWDGSMEIKGYGEVRLILVKKKGRPTPIITNDDDRSVEEIVELMFNRWSQENFFKYMAQNFSLDELVCQQTQDAGSPMVVNSEWLELTKKIRATRKKVKDLERAIGQLASGCKARKHCEDERKDPFVIKVATLKRAKTRLSKLTKQLKECPRKVLLSKFVAERHQVIPTEGKLILDAIKLSTYNAEEWLLDLMQQHYRDWRDPRPILKMILHQKGDIIVEGDEVRICLEKFEHPAYQRAASGLCQTLNALEPKSWDGRWRFHYEVAG